MPTASISLSAELTHQTSGCPYSFLAMLSWDAGSTSSDVLNSVHKLSTLHMWKLVIWGFCRRGRRCVTLCAGESIWKRICICNCADANNLQNSGILRPRGQDVRSSREAVQHYSAIYSIICVIKAHSAYTLDPIGAASVPPIVLD